MHVSGNTTTKNANTTTGQTADVRFNLPEGGDASDVDSNAAKVSLNGNVLDGTAYSLAVLADGEGTFFRVTNLDANVPWPPVSDLVVECDYLVAYTSEPDDLGPYDWMELLQKQAAQIADLEARVTALETP